MIILMILLIIYVVIVLMVIMVHMISLIGGSVWTRCSVSSTSYAWTSIASSSSGTILAVTGNPYIFVSTSGIVQCVALIIIFTNIISMLIRW